MGMHMFMSVRVVFLDNKVLEVSPKHTKALDEGMPWFVIRWEVINPTMPFDTTHDLLFVTCLS